MADADLERFHDGYRRNYHHALAEINAGRKRSHWMWFIFPQVAGLGSSPTAAQYAIGDRAEAEAFLRDPTLGPGYRTLVEAVRRQVVDNGAALRTLFGRPDDQKLVSSLTLFAGVAADLGDDWADTVTKANEILDHAEQQGLPRCATTRRFLAADARPLTPPRTTRSTASSPHCSSATGSPATESPSVASGPTASTTRRSPGGSPPTAPDTDDATNEATRSR